MSWEKHLEHWLVLQRVGWLNWFFIALSRIGMLGIVWLVLGAALALLWRRPAIAAIVLAADGAADLLASLGVILGGILRAAEEL